MVSVGALHRQANVVDACATSSDNTATTTPAWETGGIEKPMMMFLLRYGFVRTTIMNQQPRGVKEPILLVGRWLGQKAPVI
jgi:hypothetical protein